MAEVSSTATTGSSIANTVLTTLDVGSGLDIGKLAQDLTDAEKLPSRIQSIAILPIAKHLSLAMLKYHFK